MRVEAWSDTTAERMELEELLTLALRVPAAGRKLACVQRLVRRCHEPVVVFTAFLDTLRALRALLPSDGVVMVHGEQPDALRAHAIRAFTKGDAAVLLATDTAAEGLNLHARCRLVVHAEVPSSSRVFEQRTGRLDRYGQARRVHAIVMSSRTREDREAMDRLRARVERDEQWIAGAGGPNCRRARVAAQRLQSGLAQHRPEYAAHDRDGDVPVIRSCTLPPRRWRRLASRLELPAGATALWTATMRVAGGPALSASCLPVLVARSAAGRPEMQPTQWRDSLRSRIARARWLVGRLTRWENDATRAIELEASMSATRDLFADASAREHDLPPAHRQSALWLTLEGDAIIGPAAGTR